MSIRRCTRGGPRLSRSIALRRWAFARRRRSPRLTRVDLATYITPEIYSMTTIVKGSERWVGQGQGGRGPFRYLTPDTCSRGSTPRIPECVLRRGVVISARLHHLLVISSARSPYLSIPSFAVLSRRRPIDTRCLTRLNVRYR